MANLDQNFEVSKQLATLSAGATVLIATFMSDIFPKTPEGSLNLSAIAKLSLFLGIATLVASTSFAAITLVPQTRNWGTLPSAICFIVGLALFAAAVYLSLNLPESFRQDPSLPDPTLSPAVSTGEPK
jgi:MFS family permease